MAHQTNLLLQLFNPDERQALGLSENLVKQHTVLVDVNELIERIYFPLDAVVSLVVPLSSGELIETAMVGRDGAVGVSAALNVRVSLNRAVVQLTGMALSCEANVLRDCADRSRRVRTILLRHENALFAQAQQSAACNATHEIESRLARWLLRASDLKASSELDLTQDYIAQMLGVRRTSVSVSAHTLQDTGVLQYRRGRIRIIDRDALEEMACECYHTVKMHYETALRESNA